MNGRSSGFSWRLAGPLALLTLAVPAAADEGERSITIHLSRSGKVCADQSLVTAVRRRASSARVVDAASPAAVGTLGTHELAAHVEMQRAATGLAAQIRLGTQEAPQRTREIAGQSCPALTDAAALIIALAAERLRAAAAPTEPSPSVAPPPRKDPPRRPRRKRVRSRSPKPPPPVEEPAAEPTEPAAESSPAQAGPAAAQAGPAAAEGGPVSEPESAPEPGVEPSPPPEPEVVVSAPETDSAVIATPSEASAGYGWALGVLGGVQSGLLPEPVLGAGLSLDAYAPSDSAVDFSFGLWRHAKSALVLAEGTAELTQYRARLAACAGELLSSPWSLRPCFSLEGGVTTTRGHRAFAQQQHRRPWAAPALAVRFLRWLGPVQLQAQVQAEAPLVRDKLQFLPAPPFYETPAVTWSASLGVGARL